jgi:hypothetical protein
MKYRCYLPWRGEFGWMIMCFIKKFHADSSTNKIICCKRGHECLFPTAVKFFYDWRDIPDSQKAGVATVTDEGKIKKQIMKQLPDDTIDFIGLSEVGWHNKHDFAQYTFIPQSKGNLGLKADIVITPRKRTMDAHRNWTHENWQLVVDGLNDYGITTGVCGNSETSFHLKNVAYKSYEHIDIDSDVELMNNAKLVVTQESGMQYLSFLCQRPTFCIDHYHSDFGADLHRNPDIPFKEVKHVWNKPELLVEEILSFLKGPNDSSL